MSYYVIGRNGDPESIFLSTIGNVYYVDNIIDGVKIAKELMNKELRDTVILFNLPITGNKVNHVTRYINEIKDINPNVLFEHYATFGDKVNNSLAKNYVNELISPINLLSYNHNDWFSDDKIFGVELLDKYHKYELDSEGDVEIFRALVLFYDTNLKNYLKDDIRDFIDTNEVFIEHYNKDKSYYINKKLSQVSKFALSNNIELSIVFAERFENELAHEIIDNSSYDKVIVLVGNHTSRSDMYKVRTSNVNANAVARLIGDGGGKENVGNFFLTSPYRNMYNGLVNFINENLHWELVKEEKY